MFTRKFGIEIEFTGITRSKAAKIAAEVLNGRVEKIHDSYDTHRVIAADGRIWKLMSDGSIICQKAKDSQKTTATREYSVELVSPVLTYREDIDTLQQLVRQLRKAGGFANDSCGIHIHLDGAEHTTASLRNFVNIIAGKNDLFYKALKIAPARMNYCKKFDGELVERLNREKPQTMERFADIWYGRSTMRDRQQHYNSSRYHFLNLHSYFNGVGTVELRGFNSELHAGKIRSYIVLALAFNSQALTQKSASAKKNQTENEKFAMRTYLNRIGLIGDEFRNCREHLMSNLSGNAAFRFGRPASRAAR